MVRKASANLGLVGVVWILLGSSACTLVADIDRRKIENDSPSPSGTGSTDTMDVPDAAPEPPLDAGNPPSDAAAPGATTDGGELDGSANDADGAAPSADASTPDGSTAGDAAASEVEAGPVAPVDAATPLPDASLDAG